MNSFISYFRESLNELQHVTWPKQDELLQLTTLTVIVVLVFAAVLAGLDWSFSTGYQYLLSL
jgi:preprotein translocase SecE subunit